MSILLQARNIEHSYREGKIVTPVLKGVNLDIASSKMTAIVGKSGSGKSTLLHVLGTLDTPDKGMVLFQEQDVTQLSESQKAKFRNHHLGFIYQFHHLLDDFTVLENVMLPLMIAHTDMHLTKSRALSLLERVGLQDRLKFLPSELSGGERQRVAIARAMVHSPELILADEPTGNLDEENATTVFNLFRELVRDEKTAVVMVTHDLSLAHQCDEIFEMVGGVVLPKERQGEYSLEHGSSKSSSSSLWDGENKSLDEVTASTATTASTTDTTATATTATTDFATVDSNFEAVSALDSEQVTSSAHASKVDSNLSPKDATKHEDATSNQALAHSQGNLKSLDSGCYFGLVALDAMAAQHNAEMLLHKKAHELAGAQASLSEPGEFATSIDFASYRTDLLANSALENGAQTQIIEDDDETVIVLQQADSNRALDLEQK